MIGSALVWNPLSAIWHVWLHGTLCHWRKHGGTPSLWMGTSWVAYGCVHSAGGQRCLPYCWSLLRVTEPKTVSDLRSMLCPWIWTGLSQ